MVMTRRDIGEILVSKKIITEEQLKQAKEAQRSAPGDLGRIIVDLELADEKEVARARAEMLGYQFVDLSTLPIDQNAINMVPERICKQHDLIPIAKNGQKLTVAFANPSNPIAIQDLRLATGLDIVPVLATMDDVEAAIRRSYRAGDDSPGPAVAAPTRGMNLGGGIASIAGELQQYSSREADFEEDADAGARLADEAPIVKIANSIIQQAIRVGASDIHVEPQRRGVRIRYRIDGVLHEEMTVPKYIHAPLISRLKIMSNMNIAERRIPQDGNIPITHEGKDYDMRVNSLPTIYGEKIVMRILDKSSVLLGLHKLGFTPENQADIEELTMQPNGMFLSTGPTGAGKTTTQYSILHKINSVTKNIITIEDPVEYQLDGISQVAVNRKAGLTFATALRAFLRQDPDIIMVGEMRDLETAEIAVESSLTGHLVLSTLHTNDAPSAVIRMIDMGVEPYLIAATVIGVLAQRLARRICSECKEAYQVKANELRRFGFKAEDEEQMVTLYRGRGCEACRHTGYKGRVGIYELMKMNAEIAELTVRRAPLNDLKEAAKANGMKELREDGLIKVLEGITTPDEVMRVVFTAGY